MLLIVLDQKSSILPNITKLIQLTVDTDNRILKIDRVTIPVTSEHF